MKQGSLLLIDDDRQVLDSMADWLRDQGFVLDTASNYASAVAALEKKPYDLVLVDIRLPDGDGFDVLAHCREKHPNTTVILLTGYGTVETAIEAIRAGAFDFLTKPLIDDELQMAIERALSQRRVIEENKTLKAQLDLRFGLENVVGHDHRMLRIFDLVDSVADTRTTVLITGESGTGKSLIARAIHRRSPRRDKPFVEVACGALPETLLESELFGHVAGSFTGRDGRQDRQVHAGRRRHDLPRRDQHRQSQPAGEAAARAAGLRVRAGRRHQDVPRRFPRHPGHQRRPRRSWSPRAASARTCTIAST